MSATKSVAKDELDNKIDEKVTECLICGKLFPRGPIDLARHGAAVTLKHIFSDKKSSLFPFGCKKCNTYFSTKEHLDMHPIKSRCNPAVVIRRIEEAKQLELEQNEAALKKLLKVDAEESLSVTSIDAEVKGVEISPDQPGKKDSRVSREAATVAYSKISRQPQSTSSSSVTSSTTVGKPNSEILAKECKQTAFKSKSKLAAAAAAAAAAALIGGPDKTVECLVCGKLFPRGELDLARHSVAVTLQHKTSKTKKADFAFNCSKCKNWFSSPQHLKSHSNLSSCGKPRRAVKETVPAAPPTISVPVSAATSSSSLSSSSSSSSSSSMPRKTIYVSSSSLGGAAAFTLNATRRAEPREREETRKNTRAGSGSLSVSSTVGISKEEEKEKEKEKEKLSDKGSVAGVIQSDVELQRTSRKREREEIAALTAEDAGMKRKEMKRARAMVPMDRKAFYAVATLLIDPRSIPPDGEKLNSKNFEVYVPESKRAILEKLKEVLLYDC